MLVSELDFTTKSVPSRNRRAIGQDGGGDDYFFTNLWCSPEKSLLSEIRFLANSRVPNLDRDCLSNSVLSDPMVVAAAQGDVKCIEILHRCFFIHNFPALENKNGKPCLPIALMVAISAHRDRSIISLHRFFSSSIDPNCQDKYGHTPLMLAVRCPDSACINALYSCWNDQLDINKQNHNGKTALFQALECQNHPKFNRIPNTLLTLFNNTIAFDLCDPSGQSTLMYAVGMTGRFVKSNSSSSTGDCFDFLHDLLSSINQMSD